MVYFGAAIVKKYSNVTKRPIYLYTGNQIILDNYLDSNGLLGLGAIHISELSHLYGNLSILKVTNENLPGFHFDPQSQIMS